MKTFREEVQAYLAWKQMKPYKLAIKAGVPWASLYRYLKGDRGLTLKTVEKIKAVME